MLFRDRAPLLPARDYGTRIMRGTSVTCDALRAQRNSAVREKEGKGAKKPRATGVKATVAKIARGLFRVVSGASSRTLRALEINTSGQTERGVSFSS